MTSINSYSILDNIQEPPSWPDANRNLLGITKGTWIDPVRRLSIFDPNEFEIFVLQWASEYLSKNYYQVQSRGGSGDKGRDIVAWIDPPDLSPRKWDNYQCKHYKDPLTPSDFWVEFGKLCYYTYHKDFTIPEKYYIVTAKGIGTTLQDFIDSPKLINHELIENWRKYCQNSITKRSEILLEGEFRLYIEEFDFSIVRSLLPNELIDQHYHTKYHSYVFGTQLKSRSKPQLPPEAISNNEIKYVQNIFDAFSDHLKLEIQNREEFAHKDYLINAFDHARESFYSAAHSGEIAQ